MKYSEKLKDPRWQRKRLEIMELFNFECSNCGLKTKTLNVHHKIYLKNTEPWDYKNELYDCLCEDCHKKEHEVTDELNLLLSTSSGCTKLEIIGYLKAADWNGETIKFKSYEERLGFFKYGFSKEAEEKINFTYKAA